MGLERLFLYVIEEKLTNLDKFPPHRTTTNIESLLFIPLLKSQQKKFPMNISRFKSWLCPFTKGVEETMFAYLSR